MTREEFDVLDIHEQINIANTELLKNPLLTLKKLRDEILNIPKTTWGDRLKKHGYSYNTDIRQYILNTNVLHHDMIKKNQMVSKKKVAENKIEINKERNMNVIQIDNKIKNDLLELVDIKNDLVKIVEEYKRNTNIIDIPDLKIDHSKLTGEVKLTTVRLYSDIIDNFKIFSDMYKEYSKQDLYSIALYEFIEKYKK